MVHVFKSILLFRGMKLNIMIILMDLRWWIFLVKTTSIFLVVLHSKHRGASFSLFCELLESPTALLCQYGVFEAGFLFESRKKDKGQIAEELDCGGVLACCWIQWKIGESKPDPPKQLWAWWDVKSDLVAKEKMGILVGLLVGMKQRDSKKTYKKRARVQGYNL